MIAISDEILLLTIPLKCTTSPSATSPTFLRGYLITDGVLRT
jgi:hypothetical protein